MRLARAAREIPEPRMSQLPTNPILDRSGTSVLTGEYQQDSPSMLPQATRPHRPLTPAQSYQRPSSAAELLAERASGGRARLRSTVRAQPHARSLGQLQRHVRSPVARSARPTA